MFGPPPSLRISRRYVEFVNARDLDGLRDLLAEDCRLIDSRGDWLEGRETCLAALGRFFERESSYHLQIDMIGRHGDDVLITGRTSASDPRFAASTIFRARTDDDRLREWQSYATGGGLAICRLLAGEMTRRGPFGLGPY